MTTSVRSGPAKLEGVFLLHSRRMDIDMGGGADTGDSAAAAAEMEQKEPPRHEAPRNLRRQMRAIAGLRAVISQGFTVANVCGGFTQVCD